MATAEECYRASWGERAGGARTDWLPGAHCDPTLAKAVDAEVHALGRGRVRSLVDLRDGVEFDRSAREYVVVQDPRYRAVTLVADNAPARMLANFPLGLERGEIPLRMLCSEAEAITWLQEQP